VEVKRLSKDVPFCKDFLGNTWATFSETYPPLPVRFPVFPFLPKDMGRS
jgi:hypothetical protein